MKKVLLFTALVLIVLLLGAFPLFGQHEKSASPSPSNPLSSLPIGDNTNICYLNFWIDGQNTAAGPTFTVAPRSMKLVTGAANSVLVRTYHDGDSAKYVLRSVDVRGEVLGTYNLYANFFTIAEFAHKRVGEIIPRTNTSVSTTIPYDARIARIALMEASSSKQVASFPVELTDPSKCP